MYMCHVEVMICTRYVVQGLTYSEFHHYKNQTSTALEFQRMFVELYGSLKLILILCIERSELIGV